MNATGASDLLVGSFVTAEALIRCIQKASMAEISLISTSPDSETDNEDILLAYYIRDRLEGKSYDRGELNKLMRETSAYRFLFQEVGVPEGDFDLCLAIDRFDFVVGRDPEKIELTLRKRDCK